MICEMGGDLSAQRVGFCMSSLNFVLNERMGLCKATDISIKYENIKADFREDDGRGSDWIDSSGGGAAISTEAGSDMIWYTGL